ncbi:MAG: hypothetical protein HRU18_26790 [Pseudoalteromonas sp.]|uniref:hypothetical protein n=1 Tax=Pseudoalteromonas sp. TaxID=53249 RepID=UPI001DA22CB4|nr:hypothetical protein [Pseudoalteromonas sp.]NRA81820.1 hypothetical protein [Pseudoalteromonas sp.]
MKLVTGTEQEITDLTFQSFVFGAPFSCFLKGDAWNNETNTVGKNTTAWQSVEYSESLGSHYIIHIDEFTFTDKTFQSYKDEFYIDEETEYSELEQSILDRIPTGYEDYSPKQYVSEVVIGDNYSVIDF